MIAVFYNNLGHASCSRVRILDHFEDYVKEMAPLAKWALLLEEGNARTLAFWNHEQGIQYYYPE